MDRAAFETWLDAYGDAWELGDPDRAAALFTPDAGYRETPFSEPIRGHDEIRAYWQDGASDGQRDIAFDYDIWSVEDNVGLCRWRCRFTRTDNEESVELDGVFRCTFAANGAD